MIYFNLGIAFGSITLLVGFGFLIYFGTKKKSVKKLIKEIGKTAEDKINADIKVWAKHTKNKFIPAGLFKYSDNKVFEVDSILLTKKALYVIEIKSIKGTIIGDSKDPFWTKVLGENKFKITNPIIQNDKHIKHIITMTGIKVPTISLIVFSNRAEKIDIKNTPSYASIVRHAELYDRLDKIELALDNTIPADTAKKLFASISGFKTRKSADLKLHKDITTGKAGARWK
ncbi:MAG: NERD domain-containing protein [Mycoplasmataceae bacterium]|nr:NERD domain-containing protein [Mycoplasmataceae bacterium]